MTGVFLNEGNPVGFEEGELIGEGELADEINAIQTGLVENGRLITDSSPTLDVDLDNPSIWRAFTGTVALGMEHIFIGTDHILFVLVLLLPAVMVFSLADGWGPVPSFKDGLFRVLKIATSFTIAHSITLALGGLGIVELNSKLVETIIAVSIIATAFHNLKPIFANREALIAFAFGIFHGFGLRACSPTSESETVNECSRSSASTSVLRSARHLSSCFSSQRCSFFAAHVYTYRSSKSDRWCSQQLPRSGPSNASLRHRLALTTCSNASLGLHVSSCSSRSSRSSLLAFAK